MKAALATYTQSGGTGKTAIDQFEAVAVMLEKYEICCGLFHGFDWSPWTTGTAQRRLSLLPEAQVHVLALDDGKARLLRAVTDLSRAFALAVPHDESLRIRDDVGFYELLPPEAAIDPSEDAVSIDAALAMRAAFAQDSHAVLGLFDALVELLTGGGRKQ